MENRNGYYAAIVIEDDEGNIVGKVKTKTFFTKELVEDMVKYDNQEILELIKKHIKENLDNVPEYSEEIVRDLCNQMKENFNGV